MRRLAQAGISIFSVTDHDTVAALETVAATAVRLGLGWIPGIEITAVENGRDVHVLGYGFDWTSPALDEFLRAQRHARIERLRKFGRRFAELGVPFDVEPLVARARARGGRSVGRGHVARALVAGGHAETTDEAFARWLAPGCPAFVPRQGAPVRDVVARVKAAGGLASLAHPALLRDDALVGRLMDSGVAAIEAYHSEHDVPTTAFYGGWATREGLALTGGSDYHGETSNKKRCLAGVWLPVSAYERLRRRAVDTGCAHVWPEP